MIELEDMVSCHLDGPDGAAAFAGSGRLAGQTQNLPRSSPDERVTPDRVVAYVIHLQALNAPMTVLSRLGDLDMALRAMAPEASRLFLRNLTVRLRRKAE